MKLPRWSGVRATTFTPLITDNYSKFIGISKQLFKSKYYEQTLLH